LPNIFTALTAHLPSADDNSLIGCTSYDSTDDGSQPVPISLTAAAPFAARLGAFFYRTRFIWSTVTVDRSIIPLRFIWSICPANYC